MTLPEFADSVVVITGAAGGFGSATAAAFSAVGAKLVLADIDLAGAERVAEDLPDTLALKVDVRKPEDMERLIRTTVDHLQRVDVLVNNAGAPHRIGPLEEIPVEVFDQQFALNTRSVYLGCKFAVPSMRKTGGGVIVNVASIGATCPRPGLSIYNATKGAVLTLTRALAVEVAPEIRVCAVLPVSSPTGFGKHATGEDHLSEAAEAAVVAGIPMGRRANPTDIADAILFLSSPRADFLTGVCLDVDGGRGIQ